MIYFIQNQSTNHIKIGYTNKPKQRLYLLKRQYGNNLVVLGVHDGARNEEQELHRRFHTERQYGEWFAQSENLSQYILVHTHPLTLPTKRPVKVSKLNGEAASARIPVTPTMFEMVRDFCVGMDATYSDCLEEILSRLMLDGETAHQAGERIRSELEQYP